MNALHHASLARFLRTILCCLALNLLSPVPARAIDILIRYDYDTIDADGFFDTQQKKDAIQAAANRYSAIITETLSAATLTGTSANTDHRIGFTHPTTGANFEISAATGTANDSLAPPNCGAQDDNCYAADVYRGAWAIPANQMIIYVGARSLPGPTVAEASSGTGLNFQTTFNNPVSHLNRGFRTAYTMNVPMWGGAISFDTAPTWHFDHTTAAPSGTTDLYSIALHEIGHILGLSTVWNEWASLSAVDGMDEYQFYGPDTRATYNADNGTSLSTLTMVSPPDPPSDPGDPHFEDNAYDSYIFQNASPNLVGTAGTSAKQDLLMEPTANFTGSIRRFELTNTDVAALRDVGWSTVPQVNSQPGDYNKDGIVNAADLVVYNKGLADGDFATWWSNFGESLSGASPANSPSAGAVPEPTSWLFLFVIAISVLASRRSPRKW